MKTLKVLIALSACVALNAVAATPPSGSYGFDWLHPQTAICIKVSEATKKNFTNCEFHAGGGSFGLASPYYSCSPRKGVEYFVYQSKAACTEAKETMDANAP